MVLALRRQRPRREKPKPPRSRTMSTTMMMIQSIGGAWHPRLRLATPTSGHQPVDLDGVPAAHFETDHPCATGVAIDHSFRSRTRFGTLRASSLTYDVRTFRSLKTAASLFPTVAPNDVVSRGSRRNSLVRRRRSWIARERMSQNPPAEACQSTIGSRSVPVRGPDPIGRRDWWTRRALCPIVTIEALIGPGHAPEPRSASPSRDLVA